MSSTVLAHVDDVLARGIQAKAFPGAAVLIARRGAIVYERGVGRLGWNPMEPSVDTRRSLYDLASLTKVMATATAVLLLYDDGLLSLDAPVQRYLPEFNGGVRAAVTVRDLLTHQGGLAAGVTLAGEESIEQRKQRVRSARVVGIPAGRPLYSDAGPMVLAMLVERVSGEPLDHLLFRRVYARLGMGSTLFRPSGARAGQVAPTASATTPGPAERGVVHDRNAILLGGIAGHAGLFGSAFDVALFAEMVRRGGSYAGVRILERSTAEAFTAPAGRGRALGWSICQGGGSCGHRFGSTAFGHTGFTGTSVWVDPERELVVVVLTNWVHRPPERAAADPMAVLADVRSDIADLAVLAILDAEDAPAMRVELRVHRAAGWYTPVGP